MCCTSSAWKFKAHMGEVLYQVYTINCEAIEKASGKENEAHLAKLDLFEQNLSAENPDLR